jgi:membrane protein required for colicin V production
LKTLDILLLLPLLFGAYNGYRRGLLLEIFSVLAAILGFILGFKFLGWTLDVLRPYLGNNQFMPYIGFSLVFLPILFLLNKLGFILKNSLRFTLLGNIDSLAGSMLGIFTFALGVSVFLLVANALNLIDKKYKKDTVVYPVIVKVAPAVLEKVSGWLPSGKDMLEEVKKSIRRYSPAENKPHPSEEKKQPG